MKRETKKGSRGREKLIEAEKKNTQHSSDTLKSSGRKWTNSSEVETEPSGRGVMGATSVPMATGLITEQT